MPVPSPISAYILAGGRSSRMGRDKALLQLGGKPLIEHAVTKLRRLTANVHILAGADGAHAELARYAPLLHDIHPGTGPIGGLEAALTHTQSDWNLILPVDLPFLPTLFLGRWMQTIPGRRRTRVALFSVFGYPQPTLLMIHREVLPFLAEAIAQQQYKLLPVLQTAAQQLAAPDALPADRVPFMLPIDENLRFDDWQVPPANPQPWQLLTAAQRAAQPLWFANLNTPAEFADAELHTAALDT